MRIPFVGPAYRLESVNQSGQRCVNLYLEQSEQGGKTQAMLVRTPGKVLRAMLGNDLIRQMLPFGSYVYVVSGYSVYRINTSYTAEKLGEIGTRTGYVSMSTNGTQVIIVDGVSGWIINIAAGTLTQIASSFPNGVTWVRYTDGYFLVGGDGSKKFYVSALNDGLTWGALDYYSAEGDPGANIAGEVDHREVFLFGETLTEVWIDTGSNAAQFQRAGNALIEVGCAAVGSVVKLDNSLFFLGRDKRGEGIVYRMNGYTPQRISDFGIEYAISGYITISDAIAFAYQQRGHLFYVLHFPTGGQTWAYDCSTQSWHQRAHLNQQTGDDERDLSNCYAFFNREHLVGDWRTGKIYALDKDVYTDNGDTIRWLRSTMPQDNENRFVFYQSFELDIEAGKGTYSTVPSGGGYGPARPISNYNATSTQYSITPSATLTGAGPLYLALAESYPIAIGSGIVSASFTIPTFGIGDTVAVAIAYLVNSGATMQDIAKVANGGAGASVTYAAIAQVNLAGPTAAIGHYDGSTSTTDASGPVSLGNVLYLDFNFDNAQLYISSGSHTYGPAPFDYSKIPAGQFLKLVMGVISTSASLVFAAGSLVVNYSETSVPFVFTDVSGGATLSAGGATVTFPTTTGHAVNSTAAAYSGKVAIPFRLNSDLPDGATVNVGLQVSPNYADWVGNGAGALIEYYYYPGYPDLANIVINDHNTSCARSGEFCLLVDIDARTSSIIIPGGTTVLGSTSPAAACGYPVVELSSGVYPGGVTLLPTSSYTLPAGYQIITG